jgi:alpha-L-fucosidase 2
MTVEGMNWPAFLAQHDMLWEQPAQRWLDGIPLANGQLGAMLWGNGAPLIFTLDKYDCWELREPTPDPQRVNYARLRALVAAGDDATIQKDFWHDIVAGDAPHPTRLPLPRLELHFADAVKQFEARLGLSNATVEASFDNASGQIKLATFVHATRRLLVIRLTGPVEPLQVRLSMEHLMAPSADGAPPAWQTLSAWGYQTPTTGVRDDIEYLQLQFPAGGEYVVAWGRADHDDGTDILLSIVSHHDAAAPLDDAIKAVRSAIADGYERLHASHAAWWAKYWPASYLSIPDAKLENLYWVEMYKLGCSSRPGGLPITLQGLWTCDGTMPPWSGDYHFDMNVQESYWPVYTANRLEVGQCLYETFFKCLERFEQNCHEFFGFDGAWSGCALAPNGARVWGYPTVEFWPGNGAWVAHLYWLHWLYSQDEQFLRDRAVPFMAAFMRTYMNLLEEEADGYLHLPLSHSPEYGEGTLKGWAKDPTCDLALIRWLAQALLDADAQLELTHEDVPRWQDTLARLVDYPQDEQLGLLVSAERPLAFSHRHHSHLMGVYPLGLMSSADQQWRQVLLRTTDQWRKMGTGQWTGWAFPWAAAIAARLELPNMAWQMLDLFARSCIRPNSLHINGDPRNFGTSCAKYEPMTLEGGFCAAAAIMEMLLQSHGGVIDVFPALPEHWHDACFADLRAEGAFLVTAKLDQRQVQYIAVTSEVGGPCRVGNPWSDSVHVESLDTSDQPLILQGDALQWHTQRGASYLLYPQGQRPNDDELRPVLPARSTGQSNWFGVKRFARF